MKLNILLIIFSFLVIYTELVKVSRSRRKLNTKRTRQNELGTPSQDDGEGLLYYLDRHNVDCSASSVIQGWQYLRNKSKNQFYIKFWCFKSEAVSTSTQVVSTSYTPSGKGGANFLDRHDLKCPSGHALQQWRLVRNKADKENFHLEATCVKIKSTGECGSDFTTEQPGGFQDPKQTFYFDRHSIKLSPNKALTGFKLNTRYEGDNVYYKFRYDWCSLRDIAAEREQIRSLQSSASSAQTTADEKNQAELDTIAKLQLDTTALETASQSALDASALLQNDIKTAQQAMNENDAAQIVVTNANNGLQNYLSAHP